MDSKTISEPCRDSSQLYTKEENLNKKSEDTQNHQNQKPNNQLLNSQDARSSHLSSTVRELEFMKISLLNQENLTFNSRVYQEHIKIYHKFTSLYFIVNNYNRRTSELIIYDTKSKSEKIKAIDQRIENITWKENITQLPNGDLICFCYNRYDEFTYIFLINHDLHVHKVPSNFDFSHTSTIYYNRSIYCFGGVDWAMSPAINYSRRFDLDQNRWINLSSVPENIIYCTTVIFNGNILISNSWNNNLWLYSIDINSFSLIPYEWKNESQKIMVNAEDRLYLIENGFYWCIYESGIWDEFSWKLLTSFRNQSFDPGKALSGIYNKKMKSIYILSIKYKESLGTEEDNKRAIVKRYYWKFDLNKKMINEEKSKKCTIF